MCGIVIGPRDDHYRPKNATWARDLRLYFHHVSLAVCPLKLEKSDKVSYDMNKYLEY